MVSSERRLVLIVVTRRYLRMLMRLEGRQVAHGGRLVDWRIGGQRT